MDFLGRAQTFVRIAERGSLSAAARSLGLSLAAVSRQVTSLEVELGAPLMTRSPRALRLTPEGTRFLKHAVRLVQEADDARASVRPESEVAGDLTLSMSVSTGLLRVLPTIPALAARHPGLRLEVRLEERAVNLIGDGVDIAVRGGLALPDSASLVAQPMASYVRRFVAAPRYLRAHGTPGDGSALAAHAAVVGSRSQAIWHVTEGGRSSSVSMTPALRVDTLIAIRDAAIAGMGIAVLPEFVVADALAAGSLRAILPQLLLTNAEIHALYRVESRGTPRIDAVLSHLRKVLPMRRSP